MVALFRDLDQDGLWQVNERQFLRALPLLKIKDATAHDMAEFFARMDPDASGAISYGEFKQAEHQQGTVSHGFSQFAVI